MHFIELTLKNTQIDCRVAAWGMKDKSMIWALIMASFVFSEALIKEATKNKFFDAVWYQKEAYSNQRRQFMSQKEPTEDWSEGLSTYIEMFSRKKNWVFPRKKYLPNFFWLFFNFILCNFLVRTLQYFQKN